jgi:hypothetical protein
LGFALSHPFARKKAKGWGTEMVQKQAVRDLAFKPNEKVASGAVFLPDAALTDY